MKGLQWIIACRRNILQDNIKVEAVMYDHYYSLCRKQLIKPKVIASREQTNHESSPDECASVTAPSKTEMFIDDGAKEGTATMSRITPTVTELPNVASDNQ